MSVSAAVGMPHRIRAISNDDCHAARLQKPRSFQDMQKKRFAADSMQHLGQAGLHSSTPARRQDYDTYFRHVFSQAPANDRL